MDVHRFSAENQFEAMSCLVQSMIPEEKENFFMELFP
ncbi:hypothetical protein SLEP1_g56221 [Rubroshorea leprosula]|uniref:Uncharacterized protein n=1 Tax=Rubroshorea leprosula TaxID=152421 RepID=A0AAV5MHV2_9ROSI|nr:hypothetical protein SLEP1_g56221 [Rubroshorea leprosula]